MGIAQQEEVPFGRTHWGDALSVERQRELDVRMQAWEQPEATGHSIWRQRAFAAHHHGAGVGYLKESEVFDLAV